MQVSALHVYPLKGGRGIALDRSDLALAGLSGDRRWMIVDAVGRFVSQREMPALALLEASPDADGGLHLSFPGYGAAGEAGERYVPVPDGRARLAARVWDDTVDAALADGADCAAISRWLGAPLRLVRFDASSARGVPRDWIDRDTPVGFADAFPLLLACEDSLRELNRAIVGAGGEAVPMSRFRPNVVVAAGSGPYAEDEWAAVRVGDLVLDLVKPCARCTVTTVDQGSGVPSGPEPIASLGRTRMSADRRAPGVLFGWNAVPRSEGVLRVGDPVEVLERREGGWPLRRRAA